MTIDRLNAQSIMIAGKKIRIEPAMQGKQNDARAGRTAARQLVDADARSMIGSVQSNVMIPASKADSDAANRWSSPMTDEQRI